MKTFLAYGILMLLSPTIANAVWCFQCELPHGKRPCPEKREFCWATKEAACFTMNLYFANKIIFSEVGCIQECYNERGQGSIMSDEVICCSTDYCNQ
ncbi:hypothetical protein JRQ81_010866 [Phrynocephalus forsythii]|uniref:UPAR/Ly6 domain-containing protein n=1 Tax=Phrynocephalus forsythii TaxID=171643 RepID=A0A9Q0X786_9SAUR|nr:hypothetical protein JRQ81_010866 [Phrynocephalus forsythii]